MVEPIYNKGHHIYTDNLLASVRLATSLREKETFTIATARTGYKGWPQALKDLKSLGKQLNHGEEISLLSNGIQCLVWKDKRPVAYINTISDPNATTHVF